MDTEEETEQAAEKVMEPARVPVAAKKKGTKRKTRSPGSKETRGEPPEKR
jgi:hypothetical protein